MRSTSKFAIGALAASLLGAGSVDAASIAVGNHNLLANTPNQVITIPVTGGDAVTGFNLRAQIGDSAFDVTPEPIFNAVQFTPGTMWVGANATEIGAGPQTPFDQVALKSIALNVSGETVLATGNVVRLLVDTTGFTDGTFALRLANTEIGADSTFTNTVGGEITPSITNGSITIVAVPEPASLGLLAGGAALLMARRRRA